VNNSCLQSCPYTAYHKVTLAHASQAGHASRGFFVDYCYLKCSFLKLLEPVNYIRSDWIRPEDLARYEALGYTTFKLTERNAPTEVMARRVKAWPPSGAMTAICSISAAVRSSGGAHGE
jgi:collagenase-like PrtC family protease